MNNDELEKDASIKALEDEFRRFYPVEVGEPAIAIFLSHPEYLDDKDREIIKVALETTLPNEWPCHRLLINYEDLLNRKKRVINRLDEAIEREKKEELEKFLVMILNTFEAFYNYQTVQAMLLATERDTLRKVCSNFVMLGFPGTLIEILIAGGIPSLIKGAGYLTADIATHGVKSAIDISTGVAEDAVVGSALGVAPLGQTNHLQSALEKLRSAAIEAIQEQLTKDEESSSLKISKSTISRLDKMFSANISRLPKFKESKSCVTYKEVRKKLQGDKDSFTETLPKLLPDDFDLPTDKGKIESAQEEVLKNLKSQLNQLDQPSNQNVQDTFNQLTKLLIQTLLGQTDEAILLRTHSNYLDKVAEKIIPSIQFNLIELAVLAVASIVCPPSLIFVGVFAAASFAVTPFLMACQDHHVLGDTNSWKEAVQTIIYKMNDKVLFPRGSLSKDSENLFEKLKEIAQNKGIKTEKEAISSSASENLAPHNP